MDTQKIQASVKSVRGFTLVELIVVITILVILGTIAFLNLGSFSSSARDSKRTSDLNQISQQILTLQAKNGTSYTSMLSGTTANTLSGTTTYIAGSGVTTGTSGTYNAGDINYSVLGVDASKFQDPSNNTNYKMGATTLVGGSYELAAKLEESNTALVMGTYVSRGTGTTMQGSGSVDSTSKIITLTSGLGVFKTGDWIKQGAGGTAVQVASISGDLKTVTVNAATTAGTAFQLAQPEVGGLISAVNTSGVTTNTPVTNKGTNLPY